MTDKEIIESLQNKTKSKKGFEALYSYFPVVKKMILSKGGTSDDAQDIYQEALILFYRKVTSTEFELTSSLNTFLYGISLNLWRNELRKRKDHSNLNNLTLPDSAEADLDEFIASEEKSRLAEKALLELAERCREILRLFYYESLSMKKIAEKFGYSNEKNAKTQKYKCLESAKNKLSELMSTAH